MPKLLPWSMLPSEWINDGGLTHFRWEGQVGSDNLAALMVLAPIVHYTDRETGIARLTYDQLELATSLSRSKISAGIRILENRGLIEREAEGRSTFRLCDLDPSFGWAKFPARGLYRDGRIGFFDELNLRKRVELDALKLWYFFVARRDDSVNLAKVTYDQIADLTGITRSRIKSGVSLLAANSMIHVEHIPSRQSEYGIANAYRLPQVHGSRHMGTVGRGLTELDYLNDL